MLPVFFISHGSPMLVFDETKQDLFFQLAKSFPTPKYILILSSHWTTKTLSIGSKALFDVIYDFYGFPPELYELKYSAKGDLEKMKELQQKISEKFPINIDETRNLDHGSWIPLLMMFPDVNIPVIHLSTPSSFSAEDFFELGKLLSFVSEENGLIIGSGDTTHNLYALQPEDAPIFKEAQIFDDWVKTNIQTNNLETLFDYKNHPFYRWNHPTNEHFLPLFFALGAGQNKKSVSFPVTGIKYGSISYLSIQWGNT